MAEHESEPNSASPAASSGNKAAEHSESLPRKTEAEPTAMHQPCQAETPAVAPPGVDAQQQTGAAATGGGEEQAQPGEPPAQIEAAEPPSAPPPAVAPTPTEPLSPAGSLMTAEAPPPDSAPPQPVALPSAEAAAPAAAPVQAPEPAVPPPGIEPVATGGPIAPPPPAGAPPATDREIEQIRNLIFGDAQRSNAERLTALDARVARIEEQLSHHAVQLNRQIAQLAESTRNADRAIIREIGQSIAALGEQLVNFSAAGRFPETAENAPDQRIPPQ